MSNRLNIRIAEREDLARMVPMINHAFAVEDFLDGTRTDMERIVPMFETGVFLIAEEQHEHGVPTLVASGYTEERGEGAYFGMLAVDPGHQGRGLAKTMFAAVEDHCKKNGANWVELNVLSMRPELLPFYRRMGYEEQGIEEFRPSRQLKSGAECHAIRMRKML